MRLHSEKGFTLLELMAATAVMGLILPLVIIFTFQVIHGTVRTNQDMVIQRDLDNASIWFNRDLSQAQRTDLADQETQVDNIRVEWLDETGWAGDNPEHYVAYSLSGSNLLRDYDGTINIAARNVATIIFSRTCTSVCEIISVSTTSAYSGATTTLNYNITPRTDNPLEDL
jgi:prepilin-type N-terminal cleavage/methylation domain-containing protein